MIKFYFYLMCALSFVNLSWAMERDNDNKIKSTLESAQNIDEVIEILDDLSKDKNLNRYMKDYAEEIGSYLAEKFSIDKKRVIDFIKSQSMLSLIPRELQKEIEHYREKGFSDFLKELRDPRSRDHAQKLIIQLKAYKKAQPKLLNSDQSKEAIKRFFEILAYEGNTIAFDDLAQALNMKDKIIEWKKLECDLIKAVRANNLVEVKNLIENKNVNPEVPFLRYLPFDGSCTELKDIGNKSLSTYAFSRSFYPMASYLLERIKRMEALILKEIKKP